ncbi:SgcJ/EcaC family oxidoreductase [Actinomadura gamaensis]|uniref:SgcJ/EcaC family oxidoreductase n=1 Tax=Actinomadura gamaensis TaxID=1763541 RepID=A0ABV9TU85_9ACTN
MTDNETRVRDLFGRLDKAWTDGDADAFAAEFADDATSISAEAFADGKDAIRARMSALFTGSLQGTRLRDEIEGLRFVGGTALVTVRSTAARASEEVVPDDRWIRATWVLAADGGDWKVHAFHACPAA